MISSRGKVIRQLVTDSHYVLDETAIAEAIVVRAQARRIVPELSFRGANKPAEVRSFRPHHTARSFRLVTGRR